MTTSSAKTLNLIPGQLTLAQLRAIHRQPVVLSLDSSANQQIDDSVACVERILAENRTAYGINTGFGLLASTRIASEDLENLQRSLVLSHAAGVGKPISDDLVRLIMVLKVNSLSRGFSGIRRVVIDALIALINAEVYPHIPLKGSVGASGDLASLAHMSLVLLGEGKARYKGEWLNAVDALAVAGLQPLTLAAKEGLALLNGTQVSTAYALRGLFEGEDLFAAALTCGSLTCSTRSARANRCGSLLPRSAGRKQWRVGIAPQLRQGSGPLLAALPATGDGRMPDAVASGCRGTGNRVQRGVR